MRNTGEGNMQGLMDSGRETSEFTELQQRLVFLKVGVMLLMGVLVLRLWQLQILDGAYYRDLAQDNRTRSVVLQPARGLIFDRHGVLLANNVPSFNLYVDLKDVPDRAELVRELGTLLKVDPKTLATKLQPRGVLTRVKVKSGLTLREAALIESHRLSLPGVVIQAEYQRNYPVGAYAGHVLGYVGEISEDQLRQKEYEGLIRGSIVGQYGIERTYDRILRGRAGRKLIEVDALGHEKRTLSVEKPRAGDDIYLTIDFRLQKLAEDLLGEEAGAIVALDPTNGEVLALASRPSFDPNQLSRGLSPRQWQAILNDPRYPLTNRAIQGLYPPGSTFKIIMAVAALATDTVEGSDSLQCLGRYRFGRRIYRDWKPGGHGLVNLHQALVQSCDVYFYKVGHRMGINTIATYAKRFGLGQKTGIDLPGERAGIVPSPEWKQQTRGEPWYPGETISVSIGQGYVTVTPIQMAAVVAAVANGGLAAPPRLLLAVRPRETERLVPAHSVSAKPVIQQADWLPQVQAALASVVTNGTGKRAYSAVVPIAGKTGTAQVVALRKREYEGEVPKVLRDHAWFVAYAPTDHPRIALAVLVEHMGHGGSAAAPLAKQLIEAYFQQNKEAVSATP
ncbi:MAG: penicillin-binding protein 2 [Nitrospirae bacterium]|nr:MAG: penicillin-binding protein 2 [Nitrospirota bacterium]